MRAILLLNRKAIVNLGACSRGRDLFDAIKAGQDEERAKVGRGPRRSLRLRWDLLSQLWMATVYPSFFSWLIDVGAIGPVHAKRYASLDGASLDGASLVGARLVGARLDGASLDGARLVGASLVGACLVGASLVGARLDGARLDGASLDGARLDGARLDGASLDGASLDGASLDGARLDGASLDGARLDGASLDGASRRCTDAPIPGWRLARCGCCLEAIPAEAPAVAPVVAASSQVALEVASG
jgi:uncharacterized protein YjbI with pentapeptide repeats